MPSMTPKWTPKWKGTAASYANRQTTLHIERPAPGYVRPIEFGSQPLGIVSKVLDPNHAMIAFAAYMQPAICILYLELTPQDPQNAARVDVEWIRGAEWGRESPRIFPDFFCGDVNRAQTVNFGPNATLWVTRNGDREVFELVPPDEPGGLWRFSTRMPLPQLEGLPRMVHSALHSADSGLSLFYTIEGPLYDDKQAFTPWTIHKYELGHSQTGERGFIEFLGHPSWPRLPDYAYGLAFDPDGQSSIPWWITDERCPAEKGIYRGEKLVIPGITGNGLCFLPDQSLLVTHYGESSSKPLGAPGRLTYVPTEMLKAGM